MWFVTLYERLLSRKEKKKERKKTKGCRRAENCSASKFKVRIRFSSQQNQVGGAADLQGLKA